MARLYVIVIFMIWLSWVPPQGAAFAISAGHFSSSFGALIIGILSFGLYSRIVARRLTGHTFRQNLRLFNRIMKLARFAIPVWFAVLVFVFDYPLYVRSLIHHLDKWPVESPAFLLGTWPPLLAMVGLWWAAYPAERALREQNYLAQLSSDIPIRRPPSLSQYLMSNFRLQLLFIYAPVLLILVAGDLLSISTVLLGFQLTDSVRLGISLASMLPVMLMGQVLLVQILVTKPLPDSPLRRRLEDLCRRNGLRISKVLLWKTNDTIGNAAVMGILPRFRYLLITDLLLETMSDEQILAVFAHEIGHVVHRHLLWMAACAFGVMFIIGGPVETVMRVLGRLITVQEPYGSLVALAVTLPVFYFVFGLFVRRLERQADIFAARTIPQIVPATIPPELPQPVIDDPSGRTFVKGHGAAIVCSALRRVAIVNNVPIEAHEWLHGSIGSRMVYLRRISDDPQHTWDFDRFMRRVYLALLLVTLAMGAWTLWNMLTMPVA